MSEVFLVYRWEGIIIWLAFLVAALPLVCLVWVVIIQPYLAKKEYEKILAEEEEDV